MMYLKTIVAFINAALVDNLLSHDVFASKQVIGIAQSLPRI